MEDRQYIILNVTDLDKVDFTQVLESSLLTVRKSIDGTKTFVKWDTSEYPTFISSLTNPEGPYTYEEILEILNTPEWINPPWDYGSSDEILTSV